MTAAIASLNRLSVGSTVISGSGDFQCFCLNVAGMSFATHQFVQSSPGSIDTRNILSVCHKGEVFNQALLREMLGYFVDENRRRMTSLAQAVEEGQRETLRHTAHAVRGSAALFGAGRLHDLAWGLALDATATDQQMLAHAVTSLRVEFAAVVCSLRHAHPEAWVD
jgi:HPt (histidine-containing phosphotransfer) domain-containing protein